MKALKVLSLIVVPAIGLVTFLGADSASATVLCEQTPAAGTDCPAASVVAKDTIIDFSAETSITLKGPFGETIDTCTESTVKGPLSNPGSTIETAKGEIEELTFANCSHPTEIKAKGSLEVHHISGSDNGTVTSSGTTILIKETVPFGECQYSTSNTDIGTLTGTGKTGGAPTFDINAKISSENGCPKGTWSGSYVYTGETNFNVSAGSSVGILCETTPATGTDCPTAVAKDTIIDFSAETSITLKGPFGETIDTCTESTVKGPLSNPGSTIETAKGEISELTFNGCTHPTEVKANGSLEVHHIAGTDNGTVTSTGTTVLIKEVALFGECLYSTSNTDIGTLTGTGKTGGAPTFDIQASIKSENGCPTGTWIGSYVYTGETNFNVSAG